MAKLKIVGMDIFLISKKVPKIPEKLGGCKLAHITNRGSKVWPGKAPDIEMTDLFVARFECDKSKKLEHKAALKILDGIAKKKFVWTHVEMLIELAGVKRFS